MHIRRPSRLFAAIAIALSCALPPVASYATGAADDGSDGAWSAPFQEPKLDPDGDGDPACVDEAQAGDGHEQLGLRANQTCKPAAGSMAVLGGRDVLYWNALEDTEEIETTIVAEFGVVSLNDQVRRMRIGNDLAKTTWAASGRVDGGANDGDPPSGDQQLDPATPLASTEPWNDGALFCSSLAYLPDGRVLAAGGTAYYHDPSIPGTKFGVSELEGLANARVYDPASNAWTQAGMMNKGRWYPTLVPLADGRVFVASGVKRLIKTAYPDQITDSGSLDPANAQDALTDSGRNVVETETFDPTTSSWTVNGTGPDDAANPASKSLPLYPRLHLLPNGQVFFNAAGQVFNPDGYAYDEATWNLNAAYDPATEAWRDLGIAGIGGAPGAIPGFRGSTFSVMLPLRPDPDGTYRRASFLTAGGIVGVSPGTYFAVADSRIDTVDTRDMSVATTATGDLTAPRWYGTGVLTPTGEVIAFSGASADEVVGPGTALPVTAPELFDPSTGTWTELESASEARTYHNTAGLLPDGRVLVGGHSPISTLYGNNTTLVPGVTSPQETRNPTFEIFTPPYLAENRGTRPEITGGPQRTSPGSTFDVQVGDDVDLDGVDTMSFVLMRRTAITHLVDGGQRAVELEVVERRGNTVTLRMPAEAAVVPPGPYFLFANVDHGAGAVPSVAHELSVGSGTTAPAAGTQRQVGDATADRETARAATDAALRLAGDDAVRVDPELAFHEIAEVQGEARDGHGHAHGVVSSAALPASTTTTSRTGPAAVVAAAALTAVVGLLVAGKRRWGLVSP
ncbi:MAG TPA: galactose oxidase-like domain-containing protein [Acidimicrobiales bacterium]